MGEFEEAELELEKVEETLAMADRIIEISRREQERIAAELPSALSEPAQPDGPAVETA
ncbi:MAG TPA: hypothetical protein VFD73_01935 [Gemmatimonadales bacterium]|nr:hypothetical protein [Gemmatimonadales bacterium]